MKVVLVNDTSMYHCGCKAVVSVIRQEVESMGGEIIESIPCNKAYGHQKVHITKGNEADLIIVNGEGTMHHENGVNILEAVMPYTGKTNTMLVNSVWDSMSPKAGKMLSKFNHIFARESVSATNMVHSGVHHERIKIFPDISVQADTRTVNGHTDFSSKVVATNSYLNWGYYPSHVADETISIFNYLNWGDLVSSLETAQLVFTGLHHGMWACIKARVPFIVYKHNCCKITGVMEYFDSKVPVANTEQDLIDQYRYIAENLDHYDELFDKVHHHPKWKLNDYI